MGKERSPFTPGRPVDVEFFVGRAQELALITRAASQVAAGRNENLFITGERGIGKSSLAALARELLEKDYRLLGTHCYVGRVSSLDEMCRTVWRALLEQLPRGLFAKVEEYVKRYMTEAQLGMFGFGVRVRVTEDPRVLSELRLEFPQRLGELYARLREDCAGLVLILDDLNGVVLLPEFARFLKSVVDELASQRAGSFPLLLMLVGLPECMDTLRTHHESVPRIFTPILLRPLSEDESKSFFRRAFESVGTEVEEGALAVLHHFGGGLPTFLHEIGDAAYWADEDNRIDGEDAWRAVLMAADRVGAKYLHRRVYEAIRSEAYRRLLRTLARDFYGLPLTRRDILRALSDKDKKTFANFLTRMRQLGVLRPGDTRGRYEFASEMERVYFWLEAYRAQREAEQSRRANPPKAKRAKQGSRR